MMSVTLFISLDIGIVDIGIVKEFVERIIEDYGKKYHPYYNNKKPRQNSDKVFMLRRIKK